MKVLLDTSALSEPLRKRPNGEFMRRWNDIPAGNVFTSTICVMEIRYGCALRGNPALWSRIQRAVLDHVTPLPFGWEEASECGDILARLKQKGIPIGVEDTQIGATALVHGLRIVTANVRHFERIPGLVVENWLG